MNEKIRGVRGPRDRKRTIESTPNHAAGERGSSTGKGKEKRSVVSTSSQSHRRRGRGSHVKVSIPANVTGTGEQAS